MEGAGAVGRRDLAIPIIRTIALAVIAIAGIAAAYFVVFPLIGFVITTIFEVVGIFAGAIISPIIGFWWSVWAPDERGCWDVRTGCLADDLGASIMTGFSTFTTMLGIVALLMWVFHLYRRYR